MWDVSCVCETKLWRKSIGSSLILVKAHVGRVLCVRRSSGGKALALLWFLLKLMWDVSCVWDEALEEKHWLFSDSCLGRRIPGQRLSYLCDCWKKRRNLQQQTCVMCIPRRAPGESGLRHTHASSFRSLTSVFISETHNVSIVSLLKWNFTAIFKMHY